MVSVSADRRPPGRQANIRWTYPILHFRYPYQGFRPQLLRFQAWYIGRAACGLFKNPERVPIYPRHPVTPTLILLKNPHAPHASFFFLFSLDGLQRFVWISKCKFFVFSMGMDKTVVVFDSALWWILPDSCVSVLLLEDIARRASSC